jgi:hypothetical protein
MVYKKGGVAIDDLPSDVLMDVYSVQSHFGLMNPSVVFICHVRVAAAT